MNPEGASSIASSRVLIEEICRTIRSILEQILEADASKAGKAGGALVRGACLHACILLKPALEKFAGSTVEIRGGDGLEDGGVLDTTGRMRGHYWLEGLSISGERFLADITADQFGLAPVVLLWPEDSWERYRAGDEATVATHAAGLLEELTGALAADCEVHPAPPPHRCSSDRDNQRNL